MANCKQCGGPLTKGNIQVVRPRGKKRPFRIHRRCPEVVEVTRLGDRRQSFVPVGDTAGTVVQRPQEDTGGPLAGEGVYSYSPPVRYRFFMLPGQVERVKRALTKAIAGFGIGFEVIPVPDYQVEADPDQYADLVEVTLNGYNGESE